MSSNARSNNVVDDITSKNKKKRLVLIRHGCTYMNEYLDTPGCRWGDADFSDVFEDDEDLKKYRDSPLSPLGLTQAQNLGRFILDTPELSASIVSDLELVVVSPLTRALQTTELGLLPSLTTTSSSPPIVALPYASERCYLISDVGVSTDTLQERFPWADFESGFDSTARTSCEDDKQDQARPWWFSLLPSSMSSSNDKTDGQYELVVGGTEGKTTTTMCTYSEWRPRSDGQTYAHVGEPDDHFNNRMRRLVNWIDDRPERTIALVCHWGVIDWLIGEDFENCEMRVLDDFDRDVKMRQR